jgi:hypothetical protein
VGSISTIAQSPALVGLAGSFIYAAPRWLACMVGHREAKSPVWPCFAEFLTSLAIGAIAAFAFCAVVMGFAHVKDINAIGALIGLLANPVAPKISNGFADIVGGVVNSKIGQLLGRGDK